MNIVKQILTIIADSPTRKVPLSALKVKDLAFYLLLMEKKGYLVNQEIDSDILDYEVYMTWEGYDFLESLNKELQQPLNEKTESGADYQKDILDLLNENIIKEIDKEEWNKVLNLTKFPFVVFEMYVDYDIIKDANFVQKFQSRLEAEAFIKDAKDKYVKSLNDKMEYIRNYVDTATDDQMIKIVAQIDSTASHKNETRYVIIQYLFDSKKQYDFEGYNPPEVLPSNSQYYHILEIKEN